MTSMYMALKVRDMADYLGVDTDSEPELLDIARMAVAAPTPPGWLQVDNADGFTTFKLDIYTQLMGLFMQIKHTA